MNNTKQKSVHDCERIFVLVGAGGFEPPKAVPTDLQSAPFGHSGTLPYLVLQKNGAGGRTRTPDLLITNQLLYQLSYTSTLMLEQYNTILFGCQAYFLKFLKFFIFPLQIS